MKLAAKFVSTADEVYRLQNLRYGTDPECRLFQKFAEVGHSRQRGASRQGTYCVTPSGILLGSINSNDPRRIAALMEKSLAKWETIKRADRLLPDDPEKQRAAIKRAERFYPTDGLVLTVNSRDVPQDVQNPKPVKSGRWQKAWNQDFAWFTRNEAKQFVPPEPKVGVKHDLPLPLLHRIACAHLIDNVRGQTAPFEVRQIKKARLSIEVTAVKGSVVSLRLAGETRAEMERGRKHGLDMRLLGKASYDLNKSRFVTFELVALGTRWGGTQLNGRWGDNEAPIGILFALADDSPCQRVAPAFTYHPVYRPVMMAR